MEGSGEGESQTDSGCGISSICMWVCDTILCITVWAVRGQLECDPTRHRHLKQKVWTVQLSWPLLPLRSFPPPWQKSSPTSRWVPRANRPSQLGGSF